MFNKRYLVVGISRSLRHPWSFRELGTYGTFYFRRNAERECDALNEIAAQFEKKYNWSKLQGTELIYEIKELNGN